MDAILFDGVTADRHQAIVEPTPGGLSVTVAPLAADSISTSDLTVIESDQRRVTLGHRERSGWRLVLSRPVDPEIEALLPRSNTYGTWIDRFGLWRATGVMAAVAGVVLVIGYTAPVWLTPMIPQSWEENLGTALVGDFGDIACHRGPADGALAGMAKRVDPDGTAAKRIPMTVLDVGVFNAAAIPGNQIVIFRGALDDVDNPDAMAGILAHEIGHVRKRHVTQALIRELGIGALVRLFAGDIGANAQQLVSLSYTRSNEEEADREAVAALRRANIDPRPTAVLFRKLSGDAHGTDSVKWLNSHPRSADRADLFAKSFEKGRAYRPSLNSADYAALKKACGDRTVEISRDE